MTSHFSSKKSAIILTSLLSASIVFVGVTLAQGLTIPTNLNNAVITIQKIFLSANGVSTDVSIPNATIALDGSNGNITNQGTLEVGGTVKFSNYPCSTNTSGCILKVDVDGNLATTDNLADFSGNEGEKVFMRTDNNPNNTFLATDNGDTAAVGDQGAYLRIGTQSTTVNEVPVNPETAMVVAGKTEIRGGILIRRNNNNNLASNTGTNKNMVLNTQFTQLDMNTEAGIVNFAGTYHNGFSATNPTSFKFNANGSTANVGINVPNGINPTATLDVRGDALIGDAGDPSGDKLTVYGSTRANNYLYNSDRRYKSDIIPLSSALESLLKITGYHYFNKLENKDSLGVIAQEVETVYPELVQTDKDGYKSVAYGNLVAPIIEAIRELNEKIESLFDKYVSQQSRIDMLEARLSSLEAKIK